MPANTWVVNEVSAVAIHGALQRNYGLNCHYSAIRCMAQKIMHSWPQLKPNVKLDFEYGDAAQVDFGVGPLCSTLLLESLNGFGSLS